MSSVKKRARVIAIYLPQYHPIPENDEWWGKGFTEWTNVGKAKPLFPGHYQPRIPADLGYYDLRLPIIREQQAEIAREAGVEGFCYYHYWFNGKPLLEKPFNEVLESGRPDFPFCLAWANHSWTNKSWTKKSALDKDKILMEQTYSEQDHINHFYHILPALKDKRYITVDSKPLFVVFDPLALPDPENFIKCWNELARMNGLEGIHFTGILQNSSFRTIATRRLKLSNDDREIAERYEFLVAKGFSAINSRGRLRAESKYRGRVLHILNRVLRNWLRFDLLFPDIYDHRKINRYLYTQEDTWENVYPTIMPNWDRSPRIGKKAVIYINSTPEVFKEHIENCLEFVKLKQDEHKIIFIQAWNEWAEGNYIEPDLKYGHGYLNALKETLQG